MRTGSFQAVLRVAAIALSLTLVVSSTPARATPLNPQVYAMYVEPYGQSVAYTGVHNEHWEEEPFGLLPPGCGLNFTSEPVYRTQHVIFNSYSWVELMIVFACQGSRFWAGMYHDFNGNHLLFKETTLLPQLGRDNYYSLWRWAEFWNFDVNNVHLGGLPWNAVGNSIDVQLEVFRAEVYSQYVVHHTLQKTISESPWQDWANSVPIQDSGMCSQPISQTSFQEKRPYPGTGC